MRARTCPASPLPRSPLASLHPAAWLGCAGLGLLALGCGGGDLEPGEIQGSARPTAEVRDEARRRAEDAAALAERSGAPGREGVILFGDLHVHTHYSIDAFLYSLPLFGGEGGHPPADACDFARYCSSLDFFSINDHAEGLTPERWDETIESIRDCAARAGGEGDPDLVPFLGWEWTQVGRTPEEHFGHKNVVLRGLEDEEIPTRPITAMPDDEIQRAPPRWLLAGAEAAASVVSREAGDFLWLIGRLADLPNCDPEVPSPALPRDCRENAPTPERLFEKLDQWGVDSLVIPHGLAWGAHAPPGARLDNQLRPGRHDPSRQRLLEVFSGHGNSEEYRPALDAARFRKEDGQSLVCPAPGPDHLPCCWQAGELARERCGDLPEAECEARVRAARAEALAAGPKPYWVFPDLPIEAWLDCDQCRDCFKPALSLRAGESAQYSLALSRDDLGDEPLRFRWGFVASSDDHHARPGTGYKQVERRAMSDARGLRPAGLRRFVRRHLFPDPAPDGAPAPVETGPRSFTSLFDVERSSSYLYPGGLVAVHAGERSRAGIWEALVERRVYGTSGPRILLWFDLLGEGDQRLPMGSQVRLGPQGVPRFEVRALGSRIQQPGCPDSAREALSPERLRWLCRDECHHPGETRHALEAIEVVRILPQRSRDEDPAELIQDPWLRLPCPAGSESCVVRFEDPEATALGRDAVYYVRALQEATPAINGAGLRTRFDESGRAVSVDPCFGDERSDADGDCLAPVHERAWSSPIFVDRTPAS